MNPRVPGFWKFNNSLLSDTKYVELLNFLIPEFTKKHQGTVDKGLFWEMIKMEIRAFTIKFWKRKAKSKCDEECALLSEMIKLQCKLQTEYSDSLRSELERIKTKLSKTCKMLSDKLLNLENLPPPTSEKKILSYGIAKEN